MYCSVALIHRLQSQNHPLQHDKQWHRKVMLSSFRLNGQTLRISPTDSKVRTTLYIITNDTKGKYYLNSRSSSFHLKSLIRWSYFGFYLIYSLKSQSHLFKHNKQHHREVVCLVAFMVTFKCFNHRLKSQCSIMLTVSHDRTAQ